MKNPFRYFNRSPEVIRLTVMMYVRYPLSLRQVEDLLFERGIDICHETVRLWWNRFGPMFAAESATFSTSDRVMPTSLPTLDALPSIVDFYAHYWNKRPFLVRDAIDQTVMNGLIAPDELAGLSLEETARAWSRGKTAPANLGPSPKKISTLPESRPGAYSSKTSNNFTRTRPYYCARSILRPVG
jgi:hypothetical protein